jgi:dienelactone hydrolase
MAMTMVRPCHFLAALLLVLSLIPGPAKASESAAVFQGIAQGVGQTPLAVTLVTPAGKPQPEKGWPALLLIQGSGPTDRDGNQPPHLRTDLLRQIAEHLAAAGIATLRFDKRGMHANNASLPTDPAAFESFFRWENFVGDAVATFQFLAGHPGIDGKRTGILGHSEGGLIALAAAEQLSLIGSGPAALVLAATPGRRLDAVFSDQLERVLIEQQAAANLSRALMAANRKIIDAIRETGKVPADVARGLIPLYPAYAGPFLQSLLKLEPAGLARGFPGPVLVLQGQADTQVSADRDASMLDNALAARGAARHALRLFPQLSHNFKPTDPKPPTDLSGPVSEDMLRALAEWLGTNLIGD